ncbi:hypothetical protein CN277_11065 [Bacillus cereus]|uniref:DUF6290 family protein n=1 Tax=Bacillus cereus TaxID=1396 RepID=UPI000BEC4CA3|nr:DUF6290 family protein [Bacillus cereus]PEE56862.1 hypothetical protein COM68_22290 [Bacillus cereus]PFC62503.1 hypothetical protein CN267_08535 [Bacillus cereus]PFD02787.1 hypothetical protein CN277_11065 [Bacillus cereus]
MSPKVTIRFNEEEIEVIQELSQNNNQTFGALIKKLTIEAAEYKQELEVTVQDIDKEAAKLPSGKEFKVRHLFEKTL